MRTSTLTEAREKEDARVTAVAEFTLPAELEAHAPPEARGLPRDGVRMLLSRTASGAVTHHRFTDLPGLLLPGDLRTDMHQRAFPGEDISDRPWPQTVVPAFTRLVAERLPSGRYRAAHLMPVVP